MNASIDGLRNSRPRSTDYAQSVSASHLQSPRGSRRTPQRLGAGTRAHSARTEQESAGQSAPIARLDPVPFEARNGQLTWELALAGLILVPIAIDVVLLPVTVTHDLVVAAD